MGGQSAGRDGWEVRGDALRRILPPSGLGDEAYRRYGLVANRAGTYFGTFRAVARKYPHKSGPEILHDLIRTTPGEEGKWFAAAKEEGLYDEALAVATSSPCNPRTLTALPATSLANNPTSPLKPGCLRWTGLSRATATMSRAPTCGWHIRARCRRLKRKGIPPRFATGSGGLSRQKPLVGS